MGKARCFQTRLNSATPTRSNIYRILLLPYSGNPTNADLFYVGVDSSIWIFPFHSPLQFCFYFLLLKLTCVMLKLEKFLGDFTSYRSDCNEGANGVIEILWRKMIVICLHESRLMYCDDKFWKPIASNLSKSIEWLDLSRLPNAG